MNLAAKSKRLTSAMSFTFASIVCALLPACKKERTDQTSNDTTALAEDGSDSSAVETDSELLTSSLVAGAPGGTLMLASSNDLNGGTLDHAGLGDGAKALYFPRGCLQVAADEATQTVTYTFNDCTGPSGLFRIRGRVRATQTVEPERLTLDVVATDLQINRANVDWHASAEITANGAARTMTWKGQLDGTMARGRAFSRTNEKTVSWRVGERCFSAAGVSTGDVRGRGVRTEIRNYTQCHGACPAAGGVIVVTDESSGVKIEVRFDGTNRATFIGPSGTATFPLDCGD